MRMDSNEVRSVLNDLIETCNDGHWGLNSIADKISDTSAKSKLRRIAQDRAKMAGDLQAEVTRMGAEPANSGSTAGAMHRGWIGLKDALGGGDHAMLEEAERGEDTAVKRYRDALAKSLPNDLQITIENQLREIQQAHNTVKALRDSGRTVKGAG